LSIVVSSQFLYFPSYTTYPFQEVRQDSNRLNNLQNVRFAASIKSRQLKRTTKIKVSLLAKDAIKPQA